jgi:hypothetical protein
MAEFVPEITDKGVSVHGFDGSVFLFCVIVFATACSVTKKNPVGSPVTGTGKSLGIHKGFQPIKRMIVECLPVAIDCSGAQTQ